MKLIVEFDLEGLSPEQVRIAKEAASRVGEVCHLGIVRGALLVDDLSAPLKELYFRADTAVIEKYRTRCW